MFKNSAKVNGGGEQPAEDIVFFLIRYISSVSVTTAD